MPEDGYGWEKLFSERMCRHFREDFGLRTRVARFHNVYGPYGTWEGGREKAPAAVCRKVIDAKETGKHEIEIWGDGKQTRSFMYIDDCVKGILAIMDSDILEPINLGSDELVTINGLVDMVEDIAGVKLKRNVQPERPQGRQRPQQRQHEDHASTWAGRRASSFATGWRRLTTGSMASTSPSMPRRLENSVATTIKWLQGGGVIAASLFFAHCSSSCRLEKLWSSVSRCLSARARKPSRWLQSLRRCALTRRSSPT